MSARSTPGPWVVRRDPIGNWTGAVCSFGWGLVVAPVSGPCDDIPDEEQSHGNAHLIAAAPDLLEALRLLMDEVAQSGNGVAQDFGWPRAVSASLAAIAKAEGK